MKKHFGALARRRLDTRIGVRPKKAMDALRNIVHGHTAARLFDERSARPDASSPQGGGAGVAMHNISERIHRFYGPHSYTRVESAPGKGAKVLLHLDLSESIFDIQE